MEVNQSIVNRIKSVLQLQRKTSQNLSEETGIQQMLIELMLLGERRIYPNELIAITVALNVEVKALLEPRDQQTPLQIVLNGELTNRRSKRAFESVLYTIEDYITMKQEYGKDGNTR